MQNCTRSTTHTHTHTRTHARTHTHTKTKLKIKNDYRQHMTVYSCNHGDPLERFDPSHPTFQGHSRSLKPTRIDQILKTS